MSYTKSLLWIDCIGGLAVGAFVIVFSDGLSARWCKVAVLGLPGLSPLETTARPLFALEIA